MPRRLSGRAELRQPVAVPDQTGNRQSRADLELHHGARLGPSAGDGRGEWIRSQIDDLTQHKEADRAAPWAVADAPETFVAAQLKGIVGLQIPIARIEGKWKVSQNRNAADQAGVAAGLRGSGEEADVMAALVNERIKRAP